MLRRFSLYGLLKNQRYFEAFLVLAFMERGLGFAEIGGLVALRELTTNVLEVPSGVMADLLGRRRTMVASFAAYVVAYLVLGLVPWLPALALGMLLIGVGDAFRSGTHKAMIFDWLAAQGRQDERVEVYGHTRSWSQVGSAVAVPIAAGVVFWRGGYSDVFWLSAIPAAINLVNLATYPRTLEGSRRPDATMGDTARALWATARTLWPRRSLRGLLVEAAAFSGLYKAVKDYLQPLLEGVALSLPLLVTHAEASRSAVLVGMVYVVLFGLSAVAS
ncbi:MAG: MFS transporter, partial [Myxococcales bacterium]|nr:MFS transporter [Myxococcales bacterium]